MRPSQSANSWPNHSPVSFARLLLVIVMFANAVLPPPSSASARSASPVAPAISNASLADQPLAVQYAVSSALGQDDQTYHLRQTGASYTAANPKQGTQAVFDPRSLQIKTGSDTWALDLAGWGRAEAIQTPTDVHTTSLVDNRMEFDYGGFTAWYVNGPGGTQQGWTLQSPPAGTAGTPLTVALTQRGTMRGTLNADKRGLALRDASGTTLLHYSGLIAFDANNKQLPVWMDVTGDKVFIRVDDRGAIYPVTIDPYIASATIENPGDPANYKTGVADDRFGTSVAVSADGQTVVVGAPYANNNSGRVYVFWPGDSHPLRAVLTSPFGGQNFGKGISVSGDGGTILTNEGDSNYQYISKYAQYQGNWYRNSVKLLPSGYPVSLALNGDGTVTAVGSPGENKVYLAISSAFGGVSNITLDGSTYGAYQSCQWLSLAISLAQAASSTTAPASQRRACHCGCLLLGAVRG